MLDWSKSLYETEERSTRDLSPTNGKKVYSRDEQGQFAKPVGLSDFGGLPIELQERILVDVAATRLQTSNILKEVYDTLATVCQDWREMVGSTWFYEKFTRLAFARG